MLTAGTNKVNFLGPDPKADHTNLEGLDEHELQLLKRRNQWRATGTAYALEHASRPSTIGLVLASSPLAVLAWVGEKLLEWSDLDDAIPLDTILNMVSLYWFTSSLPRCIWPYRDIFYGEPAPISKTKPLGYSAFKDLDFIPKAWAKTTYPNLAFRKDHHQVRAFYAGAVPSLDLDILLTTVG